ncbi:MAG: PKD domain-containing protein [Saprospiraceae bacterium]|nr:PKD domain-containing protein [Saprospiraceae bacterium]
MRITLLSICLLFSLYAHAQQPVFSGTTLKSQASPTLDQNFTDYQVYEMDFDQIDAFVKQEGGLRSFGLQLGDDYHWQIEISANDIRAKDFVLRERGPNGDNFFPKTQTITYQGTLSNDPESVIRLTIDKGLFFGYIESGKKTWYVEPLHYLVEGGSTTQMVVYEKGAVIPHPGNMCAMLETEQHGHEIAISENTQRVVGQCFVIRLALMSDGHMFTKYGSTPIICNRLIGIINNVQGNFLNIFSDNFIFEITEIYVITSPSLDPWPQPTDVASQMANFTGWAPTGFLFPHDLGQLWSNRQFQDGILFGAGIQAGACSEPPNGYSLVIDYFFNADHLRRASAHMFGHNFNATHDNSSPATIMSGVFFNTANNWSEQSIMEINAFIPTISCLQNCVIEPVFPSFTSNITQLCPGSMVTFYDQSNGTPLTWSWSFPGGTPASSTNANPTVTYNSPGSYSVTLTTTSPTTGTQTLTIPNYINVAPGNGSDFFYLQGFESGLNGWTISNPDGALTWQLGFVPSARQDAGAVMYMDNAAYNGSNHRDALISPVFDFTGRDMISLEFDHAYAKRTLNNIDSLLIYVSTDGGATYPNKVFTGVETGISGNFATRFFLPEVFFPLTSEDWCFDGNFGSPCISVDLSAFAQATNVRIKIENVANYGNTFYLDNVRLVSDCYMPVPPIAEFIGAPTAGCAPMTVQFADLSQNIPTSWIWSFPGGIPAASTSPNPQVTYPAAGSYDVTLTAINGAGSNTITLQDYIVVDNFPVAGFTYVLNGNVVNFTSTSTNATSYLWDFGDGTFSSMQNPSHIFPEDGFYLVSLTVTNACGTNTFFSGLLYVLPPEADFSADPVDGCTPMIVQFNDESSSSVVGWEWDFPGGEPASSDEPNPEITYNNPGTYDVTLIVFNPVGSDTITYTNYISVDEGPTADFLVVVNGNMVDLTNNSTNATSYLWDFGDSGNTSTDTDPGYTYAADGDYLITLIAMNDCGADTLSIPVVILTQPTADFSASPVDGCAPLSVDFTNLSSADAESFIWEFPGGFPATSTDINPSVVYVNSGVYTVVLIANNPTGSDTLTQTDLIVVDDVPNAAFSSVPTGLTIDFTNATSNGNTYEWFFGDGNMSTLPNPSNTYATDGVFDVTLIATNDCGSDTIMQQVSAGGAPTAGFFGLNTEACVPQQVEFFDQSLGTVESWEWAFPGGNPNTSTDQNPVVNYDTPGVYDVTLSVTNTLGTSTLTETGFVIVGDIPSADFTVAVAGFQAVFTNTSTNANDFEWFFGDGNMSTQNNPTYSYTMDGTYTVTLIASNDCGSDTTTQELTIATPPIAGFSATNTAGCAPLIVEYTNESSENVTGWAWEFPGGTPSASSDPNPIITYNTAGVYDATLTVSNSTGDQSITQFSLVVVDDIPQAGFTSVVLGSQADFTNTSTNANSYEWFFGDGNMSMATDPTYTYAMDGNYFVTLVATNDCGPDTTIQNVVIGTPPLAGFTVSNTSGCAPLEVSFADASSDNVSSWSWEFPGGTPSASSDPNPIITYNTAGTYDVTLTVSNVSGDNTVTQFGVIVVEDIPQADFGFVVNGLQTTFSNTTQAGDSYEWFFGDGGFSIETDPIHDYALDGDYLVTLIATNDCGSDTTLQSVTINTPPTGAFSVSNSTGCAPLIVTFTNESSENVSSWSWDFPGGTPSASSDPNPVITYNTAGVYDVSLTVSNSAGESTVSQTGIVVVDDVPNAAFSNVITGLNVDFTNTTTNANGYEWQFGDGDISMDVDPSHVFDMDGTYTVLLIAMNDCGNDTSAQTITILTPPSAGFTVDQTVGCVPMVLQFSDASSENTTAWNWSFPGGNPSVSSDPNPIVTYDTPGTYDVTLEVSNGAGTSTVTETALIVVGDIPDASFTSSVTGAQLDLQATITGATDILWEFGDGNMSMLEDPSYTYPEDGIYLVSLTVTNDCGSATITETIVIATQIPSASFSANQTSGCTPFMVSFENLTTGGPAIYAWDFPGGTPASSTLENPVVTYNSPGQYPVTLTATNVNGDDVVTLIDYITVEEGPTADYSAVITNNTVAFTNLSVNADTYLWSFGDGNISTALNTSYTYNQNGTFNGSLIATNGCGSDTIPFQIVIQIQIPVADFFAETQEGCVPFTVQFFDMSGNLPTYWNWNFPGGTPGSSTEQNPVVTYNTAGNYSVSLTVGNVAGSNALSQSGFISVGDVPTASFSASYNMTQVSFSNNSTGADTYLWDFGDDSSSSLISPIHNYAESGTYTVVLEATNECGTTTFTQVIEILLDNIHQIGFLDRFAVYPNPNNGQFYLLLEGTELPGQQLQLTLYTVLGQVILEEDLSIPTNKFTKAFDIQDLAKGIYILRLGANNKFAYVKVIVD